MGNKAYASYTITDLIDGLQWKGALSSAPVDPQESWAYYNTEDKCSYIYSNGDWVVMAQDGEKGDTGTVTGSLTFYCATATDVFAPDSTFTDGITDETVKKETVTSSTSSPPVNWYSENKFFGTKNSNGAWDTRLEESDDGRPSNNPCVWSITLIRSQVGGKWLKAHDPLKVSLMTAATMAARIQIADDPTNPKLNTENMKVATWCGREKLSLIDGSAIAANSITANQIEAGTISTAQLAADAITAEKLAIDAITSRNYYKLDNDNKPTTERSGQGMAIDLQQGTLNSAHFQVNDVGEITATRGTVGGWFIQDDMLSASSSLGVGLYRGSPSGFPEYFGESLIAVKSLSPVRFFCGSSSQINDAKFMVLEDGSLYATAAKFTGANVSFDDSVQVNTGSGTSTTLGEMSNIIINLNGTISNLNNTIAELQNQIENLQGRVTGVEKEKDIYGVYFDPNGGSFDGTGELKFIAFNENKTVNLDEVPEPTREYYEFIGWFTTKSGGDQINSETIFDGTTTVYAHWKQNRFKITFTTYTNPDYKEEMWTNDKGQLAADQLPTLRGINSKDEFLGWYSSNRGGNRIDTNTIFDKDTTIHAHWQFTIQFNKLNESADSVSNIKTAEDGSGRLSSIPSLPYWEDSTESTDYYCNGWYTLSSGGTKITTSYQFTSSTTVYAQWRVGAVWTITFDPQGGILQGSSDKIVYTEMSGKLNSLPEAYLSNNFEFLGWFVDPSGGARITTDTVFTEDTTVYAHWKNLANIYTITFYDLVWENNQYVYTPHSEKYETDEFGRWSGTLPQLNGDSLIILVGDEGELMYEFNGWYTGYRNYIGQAGDDLHEYLVGGNMSIYANYTLKELNGHRYRDVNQDNISDDDHYTIINDHLPSAIEASNGDIFIDGRTINCSQTLKYINDVQGWVYTERQEDWYSTLPVPIAHWIYTLSPLNNTYIIYLNKEYGDYGGCRISHQYGDASREIFVLPPSTDFSYFGSQAFIAGGIEIWYNSEDEMSFGEKLIAAECPEDWIIGATEGDTILVTSFDSNGNLLAQEEFDVVYDPSLSK